MAAPQETQPGRFRPKGPLAPSTNPALSIRSVTDTAAIESITFPQSQEGTTSRRERVKGKGSRTKRILAGTAAAALIVGGIGFGINEVNKGIAATEELTPKPQPQDQTETLATGSPTQQIKINETTGTIVIPETKEPLTPRIRTSQSTNEGSTPTPFETRAAVNPDILDLKNNKTIELPIGQIQAMMEEADRKGELRIPVLRVSNKEGRSVTEDVLMVRIKHKRIDKEALALITRETGIHTLASIYDGTVMFKDLSGEYGAIDILGENKRGISMHLPPNSRSDLKEGERVNSDQNLVLVNNDFITKSGENWNYWLNKTFAGWPKEINLNKVIAVIEITEKGNLKVAENLDFSKLLRGPNGEFITPASSKK